MTEKLHNDEEFELEIDLFLARSANQLLLDDIRTLRKIRSLIVEHMLSLTPERDYDEPSRLVGGITRLATSLCGRHARVYGYVKIAEDSGTSDAWQRARDPIGRYIHSLVDRSARIREGITEMATKLRAMRHTIPPLHERDPNENPPNVQCSKMSVHHPK
jgi:hypothetical protein